MGLVIALWVASVFFEAIPRQIEIEAAETSAWLASLRGNSDAP